MSEYCGGYDGMDGWMKAYMLHMCRGNPLKKLTAVLVKGKSIFLFFFFKNLKIFLTWIYISLSFSG